MKILLTGATGFIGKYVSERLVSKGIDFVTVGRNTPKINNEHINSDLLSTNSFDQIIEASQATHLIHLAWYAEHGKYWSSPLNDKWVHATQKLIVAFCKSGGKGVVLAGTCAEYDWSDRSCSEKDTPVNPQSIYGIAKNKTRKLVMKICEENNVPCIWGRIFSPYGREENYQRLIPSLISVFRGEASPFGVNSNQYRDFLHAYDVAEAFIFLMFSGQSGIFNISSGKPIQINELVFIIAKLLKANPKKILDLSSEKIIEPSYLVGKNLKLKNLGWMPKYNINTGIKELLKV